MGSNKIRSINITRKNTFDFSFRVKKNSKKHDSLKCWTRNNIFKRKFDYYVYELNSKAWGRIHEITLAKKSRYLKIKL